MEEKRLEIMNKGNTVLQQRQQNSGEVKRQYGGTKKSFGMALNLIPTLLQYRRFLRQHQLAP